MIAGDSETPRVVRASLHLAVLIPIRLGLGLAGLVAAVLAGERPAVAAAAFALGAIVATSALAADRRWTRKGLFETVPLPAGADIVSARETAAAGIWPSTVGVSVLTLAALFFNGALAALLAGILGGMGLATILSRLKLYEYEREYEARYYVEHGGGARVFAERRG